MASVKVAVRVRPFNQRYVSALPLFNSKIYQCFCRANCFQTKMFCKLTTLHT